jgi:hypothetical protein
MIRSLLSLDQEVGLFVKKTLSYLTHALARAYVQL